jgi:6-hydroxy-3-succinoylpyridine 3-monooxygenase
MSNPSPPAQAPPPPPPKRSIVYIDGFNLYYGAIKGTQYKWLNLEDYFTRLRQSDSIQRIYYFSALVTGPSLANQQAYLRALATLPLVRIVLGRYKNKRVKCLDRYCQHPGQRIFQMPEEKHTDVNIAVQMVVDAFQNTCDTMILVSGDSDLVPGVNRVKSLFPEKEIIVYVPSRDPVRGAAVELRASANTHRDLPLLLLKPSQFPHQVPDGAGAFIQKPATW